MSNTLAQTQARKFLGARTRTLSITNAQMRAVLMNTPSQISQGKTMFDDVDAKLQVIGGLDLMAWEYVNTISRNSPLVGTLGVQLGLSSAELDALFQLAAGIAF